MDFLEAITRETTAAVRMNQNILRKILEAAKVSEEKLDEVIRADKKNVNNVISFHYYNIISVVRSPRRNFFCI